MRDSKTSPSWSERSGWSMSWELKRWVKCFLGGIPGRFGSFLRQRGYPFSRCGFDVFIGERFWCEYPEHLELGDHVGINRGFLCNAAGGVSVGDWTLIGPDVTVYSQNHTVHSSEKPRALLPDIPGPVSIGSNCWIGARAVILAGVTIGDNAVVGAGAVVTHDVASNDRVVGVPARNLSSGRA